MSPLHDIQSNRLRFGRAADREAVAVVGASNVRRGLSQLWSVAQGIAPDADVAVACGHGRALACASGFGLGVRRLLNASSECRLWSWLEGRELVGVGFADLGNDLAYGIPAARLLSAFDACRERLPAETPVTVLHPSHRLIRALTPLQFHCLAGALYPGRSIVRERLLEELEILAAGLERRKQESGPLELVEPPSQWFGWDRIHVRRRYLRAWAETLVSSRLGRVTDRPSRPLPRRVRWWARGEEVWLQVGGRSWQIGAQQPCFEGGTGAGLWMF